MKLLQQVNLKLEKDLQYLKEPNKLKKNLACKKNFLARDFLSLNLPSLSF